MDAVPRSFDELPTDPAYGVPVPFAAGTEVGASVRDLDKRRVTQCALSRVCGVCGATLERPLAFVGSRRELDRMAFRVPPAHVACAESLLEAYADVVDPILGLDVPPGEWVVVTTASFEFVRPGRDDVDRRPVFSPNGVLEHVGPITSANAGSSAISVPMAPVVSRRSAISSRANGTTGSRIASPRPYTSSWGVT